MGEREQDEAGRHRGTGDTHTWFTVHSASRTAIELSEGLGLPPDEAWTRGEPFDPNSPDKGKRRTSGIRYNSRFPPDHSAEEQLADLVTRLLPCRERLIALRSAAASAGDPSFVTRFWIYADPNGARSRAFSFPADLLADIASFGADLGIDVLFDPPR